MTMMGKLMVLIGAALILLGVVVWLAGRTGFRGLPGDIVYESDGVRVYIPVVTCLVLSAAVTLALWLWQWWTR